jgi:hypothetical protein
MKMALAIDSDLQVESVSEKRRRRDVPLSRHNSEERGARPWSIFNSLGEIRFLGLLVSCRSEFVTGNSAGGIRIFPADRPSVGRVGVDIAAEFAS